MRNAAALLIAILCPTFAGAAEFGASSSKASRSSGRLLIWTHDLGGGTDRVLTVAVTTEDNQDRDPGLLVLFGTSIMRPVTGGVARASSGKGQLRTPALLPSRRQPPRPGPALRGGSGAEGDGARDRRGCGVAEPGGAATAGSGRHGGHG